MVTALAAFARRDQPPADRAAGRAHEMRVWATDDVFTALTSEARERGWTLSRVIEALLIEVTKTRARVAELEKKRQGNTGKLTATRSRSRIPAALISDKSPKPGLRHGQPRHQPFANSAAGDVAEEPHEPGDAASLVGERRSDRDHRGCGSTRSLGKARRSPP